MVFYYQGGLGNQLFQFCAHKFLERILEREILVNDGWYLDNSRVLDLSRYTKIPTASSLGAKTQSLGYFIFRAARFISVRARSPVGLNLGGASAFADFSLAPDLAALSKWGLRSVGRSNVLAGGLFQSRELVRSTPEIHSLLLAIYNEGASHIDDLSSAVGAGARVCAVHLRLGDYLSEANERLFGTLDLEFYRRAILEDHENNPGTVYLLFSDSPDLALRKISVPVTIIPAGTYSDSVEGDWALIASCDKLIFSNSTFAWWAAHYAQYRNPRFAVTVRSNWYANKTIADSFLHSKDWNSA